MPIELHPDPAKNLLTIRYSADVTAADTAANLTGLKEAIDLLRPDFGLLVDLTQLTSMDPACAAHISAVMDYANAHRVAAVVRVIPDPRRDIGMEIMSRFHYGNDVKTFTCDTVEEAMRLLFD